MHSTTKLAQVVIIGTPVLAPLTLDGWDPLSQHLLLLHCPRQFPLALLQYRPPTAAPPVQMMAHASANAMTLENSCMPCARHGQLHQACLINVVY